MEKTIFLYSTLFIRPGVNLAQCDSLRTLANEARSLASEKNPVSTPLIVQTEHYTSIAIQREMLGVTINAPFGSGKTVGIGLKSYHDSLKDDYPMKDSKVILLRSRLLMNKNEAFRQYLRSNVDSRVLCGGPIVTALWFTSKYYSYCSDSKDKTCYTTITQEEAKKILDLLEKDIGRKAKKIPNSSNVSELLDEIKNILKNKYLYIIIDEIEGFFDILGPHTPGELVFSNMAFAAKLYDEGIRNAKLVLLVQSAYIDREWDKIIDAAKQGIAYPETSVSPRIYECNFDGARERIGTEAIAGRVVFKNMKYYNENVYLEYIKEVLKLAINKCNNTLLYYKMENDIMDPRIENSIASMLSFLRSIAPRIGFDYIDEILEYATQFYGKKGNIKNAFKEALKKVAGTWKTADNIKKYYGMIFLGEDIFRKGLSNQEDSNKFIDKLALRVYDQVLGSVYSKRLKDCNRSQHLPVIYYSTLSSVVACKLPLLNSIIVGILVFRKTKNPPKRVSTLAGKLGNAINTAINSLNVQYNKNMDMELYKLTIAPEGVERSIIANFEYKLRSDLIKLISNLASRRGRQEARPRIRSWEYYIIRSEDMAVLLDKLLRESTGIGLEDQFVEQRFNDIIAEMSAKLTLSR